MNSVNKVILIGNIGKDPEIRSMQNGNSVASFPVATSESWKDKSTGDWKDKTEWHNIVVFNQHLVKFCESHLEKGMKVYIEGALETRKWQDKNGVDKYTTEIMLKAFKGEITLLSKKEEDSHKNETVSPTPAPVQDDLEDEIPF